MILSKYINRIYVYFGGNKEKLKKLYIPPPQNKFEQIVLKYKPKLSRQNHRFVIGHGVVFVDFKEERQ